MSLRDALTQITQRYEPAVKNVIRDVLLAEQEKIDMQLPHGIHRDVAKAIDDQVRREESA